MTLQFQNRVCPLKKTNSSSKIEIARKFKERTKERVIQFKKLLNANEKFEKNAAIGLTLNCECLGLSSVSF